MAEKINDGGAAFPQTCDSWLRTERDGTPVPSGMSLRDYFAAKAMQGRLSSGRYAEIGNGSFNQDSCDAIARVSYKIADAMIAEREKQK